MIFVLPTTSTLGSRLTAYPPQQVYIGASGIVSEIVRAGHASSRGDAQYILHLAVLADNIIFWRHNAIQI